MSVPEPLTKLASRLRDETLNVVIWICKVSIAFAVFDWALRHCGFDSFSDFINYFVVSDKDAQPFGIGMLFVFAVCLYTITRRA